MLGRDGTHVRRMNTMVGEDDCQACERLVSSVHDGTMCLVIWKLHTRDQTHRHRPDRAGACAKLRERDLASIQGSKKCPECVGSADAHAPRHALSPPLPGHCTACLRVGGRHASTRPGALDNRPRKNNSHFRQRLRDLRYMTVLYWVSSVPDSVHSRRQLRMSIRVKHIYDALQRRVE